MHRDVDTGRWGAGAASEPAPVIDRVWRDLGPSSRRALALVGLLLLLGAPSLWALTRPADSVGPSPAAAELMRETVTSHDPTPGSGATSADDVAGSSAHDEEARLPPPSTTALSGAIDPSRWPVQVELPGLGVVAAVEPVGLDGDGAVEIPGSPQRVGWYQRGSVPGRAGTAVLASHVDSRAEGRGVFFRLAEMVPGDPIELVDASGERSRWVVVARDMHLKQELPSGVLFAESGPVRIALVTCGGRFDTAARSYTHNIIVWAEPLPA